MQQLPVEVTLASRMLYLAIIYRTDRQRSVCVRQQWFPVYRYDAASGESTDSNELFRCYISLILATAISLLRKFKTCLL